MKHLPIDTATMDDTTVTESEVERIINLLYRVKREGRTLIVQKRFDKHSGLYMALTVSPAELEQLR